MIINRLDVKAKEKPNFLSFLLLGQAEDTWHTLKKKEIYLIRFGLALSLDILMYLLFGCGRVCIDSSFLSVYSLYLPPFPSLLPSLFFLSLLKLLIFNLAFLILHSIKCRDN